MSVKTMPSRHYDRVLFFRTTACPQQPTQWFRDLEDRFIERTFALGDMSDYADRLSDLDEDIVFTQVSYTQTRTLKEAAEFVIGNRGGVCGYIECCHRVAPVVPYMPPSILKDTQSPYIAGVMVVLVVCKPESLARTVELVGKEVKPAFVVIESLGDFSDMGLTPAQVPVPEDAQCHMRYTSLLQLFQDEYRYFDTTATMLDINDCKLELAIRKRMAKTRCDSPNA